METPELVAAREVVRTSPAADLATLPSGLAPCHTVLLATCRDCVAAEKSVTGPVTTTTTTCNKHASSGTVHHGGHHLDCSAAVGCAVAWAAYKLAIQSQHKLGQ